MPCQIRMSIISGEVWESINTLRLQAITGKPLQSLQKPIGLPCDGEEDYSSNRSAIVSNRGIVDVVIQ